MLAFIDLIGEAYVGDELVWRGATAYLARDATLPGMLPEDQPDAVMRGYLECPATLFIE